MSRTTSRSFSTRPPQDWETKKRWVVIPSKRLADKQRQGDRSGFNEPREIEVLYFDSYGKRISQPL